jgi:lysine/ornithine N-monooxygenase
VIHGWNTQAYENLRGQRIMVVGRGQSAGEAIAELRSHNQVTWVYRSDVIYHADPIHLPKSLFELALLGSRVFAYLPSKLRNSLTKAFVGTTMTPDLKAHVESPDVQCVRRDAQSLDLTLRDGLIHSRSLSQDFDYLVACTGYKPGVDRIRFLSPQIRDAIARIGAMPLLNRHFETTVPGLFMVGGLAEPIHGPAQRFMVGARNATLAVCPVLVRRCRATAMAG